MVRGLEVGESGGYWCMSIELGFGNMKRNLDMDAGYGCTAMQVYLMPLRIVKMGNFILSIFYHNFLNGKERFFFFLI